jgi:hypothetical protein
MAQTATTGNLANAQRIIIAATRYTEEHNAPAMALTEQFSLQRGAKTVTVPKVNQMTIVDLVDGQDIVDEEDIGMTTVDLTSSEVGAKVVLTDKLVRQSQSSVFSMVGRQLGDGMARKKDGDVVALYTNLNGGTTLGAAAAELSAINLTGCIAHAKANKFPTPVYVIHHPNAVAEFVKSAAVSPSANYPVPNGWSADLLKNFYVGLRPINGVPVFEDGNISADSSGDGIGAIASKGAMATLTSVKMKTERQRDASLRGTEVVITADYGVFELDDSYGAPMTYDVAALATS